MESTILFDFHEQGSAGWHLARKGKVTASRFDLVMKKVRGGTSSQSKFDYRDELVLQNLNDRTEKQINAKQLSWGSDHEDDARDIYTLETGNRVDQAGFMTNSHYPGVGASLDGLVGDDGSVEIKCPYQELVHLRNVESKCVPPEYNWQIQGGLWLSGRKWCDFISYHPAFPKHLKISIVRVERDLDAIDELEIKIPRFAEEVRNKVERLRNGK